MRGAASGRGLRRFLLGVALVAPVAVAGALAIRYFTPLPYGDYWDALYFGVVSADDGPGAVLSHLWSPCVDQRMVFPKAAITALALLTDNRHYAIEIGLGFAAQVMVLFAFLAVLRPLRTGRVLPDTLLWLAPAYLLFWPVQWPRFQNHWYSTQYSLVLAPAMLAVLALARRPGTWLGLGLAWLGALVSGYAHGTGALFSVAVGVAIVVFSGWSRGQRVAWWSWTIVLVLSLRIGMPAPSEAGLPTLTEALSQPLARLRYAVACLGVPEHPFLVGSLLLALLVLALCVLGRAGRLRDPQLFPIAVIVLWILGTAATSAAFRGGPGREPGEQYLAFFVLFPIVVIALLVQATGRRELRLARGLASPWVVGPLLLLGAAIYASGAIRGIGGMKYHCNVVRAAEARLRGSPVVTLDDLHAVFPFERIITMHIPALRDRGLLQAYPGRNAYARPIPVRFRLGERARLVITRGGPEGVSLEARGEQSHITLNLEPPLEREAAVAFKIRVTRPERAFFQWRDARGWRGPPESRFRGREVDGWYWFHFPETRADRRTLPITALRVVFTDAKPGQELAVFGDLRAWAR
jgi:hypothetical protein